MRNNKIIMSNSKYHTIDPLILETLNLNQNRMNHILDILHGRTPQRYSKTQRKPVNQSMTKASSPEPANEQEKNLPPILFTQRKQAEKRAERFNRSTVVAPVRRQVKEPDPIPEKKVAPKPQRTAKLLSSKAESSKKRPSTLEISRSRSKQREQRVQQLSKDYKGDTLRRVKSQQINPKDVYRMEIENLVRQLTDIEQLEESQAKMKRLKKRHRHLHTFDKQYYLRLNQHDMSILS